MCYAPTKRNILRVIAGIYDPIGFIQPLVVKFKILFQEICLSNVSWDDDIPDNLKKKWFNIIDNVKQNEKVVIHRCYYLHDFNDPIVKNEIHGFSDASEVAYGCCIYIKYITQSGNIGLSLVTSKSRIIPNKKKFTIPRLELLGNYILSRLVVSVLNAFNKEIVIDNVYCYSDSQISLAWIKAVEKEFKVFVQNRVVDIRKNVNPDNWFYCRTYDNPADIITRFKTIESLESLHLWWHGPSFLMSSNDTTDKEFDDSYDVNIDLFQEEILCRKVLVATVEKNETFIDSIIDINKYSDFLKLLRVTSLVYRFVDNLKKKVSKKSVILCKYVTTNERRNAKLLWLKCNQYYLLKENDFQSLKRNLNIKIDENGLYRTFSRFKYANLPYDVKAPVVLCKSHKLAELIVFYSHTKVLHNGVKQTLTEIRTQYWISSGRSFVKKLLNLCVVCKKINSRPYSYPNESDLPKYRFNNDYPFTAVGIDYLGPLYCLPVFLKTDDMKKVYVSLYTCAATRAIILDVVHNAKADTFIYSFTRFIARRGCPSLVVSDNGTNFTADVTQSFVSARNIVWKFNIDAAPWWGGMWERLVGSVKRCAKKVIGMQRLSFIELQTLMLEIELILNNRPLCEIYDDDVEEVLTPNHLLFGRRIESTNFNENNYNPDSLSVPCRYKHINTILNHFWNRWSKEYLAILRDLQKTKAKKGVNDIEVDDIVLIEHDKMPRQFWRLGRVLNVIRSRDNKVRAAEVKVGKTEHVIKRPVNKLYSLNLNPHNKSKPSGDNSRVKRNAAIIGEIKRRDLTN